MASNRVIFTYVKTWCKRISSPPQTQSGWKYFNIANGRTILAGYIAVLEKLAGRKLERRHEPARAGTSEKPGRISKS